MNFQVEFLNEAEQDIDDIEKYLSQYYESTVKNFFSKLKKQILMLRGTPYMYPEYEKDTFFRKMVCQEYLLFYSVNEAHNLVLIHRIFHSSRNISKQILADR